MEETIKAKKREIAAKKKEIRSGKKQLRGTKKELKALRKELNELKKEELRIELKKYVDHPKVRQMKDYTQHGSITTYDHCERVAKMSLKLNRRFHLRADEERLAVGALLHDFYLYDWHDDDGGTHRLHGFTHPEKARQNAVEVFDIDEKEQDIIRTHMWPLTLSAVPKSREAAIVCVADKWCSLEETLFMRSGKK